MTALILFWYRDRALKLYAEPDSKISCSLVKSIENWHVQEKAFRADTTAAFKSAKDDDIDHYDWV